MTETLQWVALGLGWAVWLALIASCARHRILTDEWARNQFTDDDRARLCAEVAAIGACTAMLGIRTRIGYAWFLAEPTPGGEIISSSGWCLTRTGLSRRGYGVADAVATARTATAQPAD